MNDHMMGYAPASHEDFREPHGDDYEVCVSPWPCGIPRRAEEIAAAHWAEHLARHRMQLFVTVDNRCMTKADEDTLYCTHEDVMDLARVVTEKNKVIASRQQLQQQLELLKHETEQGLYGRYDPVVSVRDVIAQHADRIAQNVSKHNEILKNIGAISGGYPCPNLDERALQERVNVEAVQLYNNQAMGLQQQAQADESLRQYNARVQAEVDAKIREADQHACQQEHFNSLGLCVR